MAKVDEQALFDQVLEAPAAERAALVARLSEGQPALRERLDRLLAIDALLDEPPDAALPIADAGPALAVGGLFAGRYKLREKLGEGGMGIVFVADQTEPVRRRVALKAIKATGNPAQLRSRFEQERQALALMDHPHIAKVLDAGVADGAPYLAMELVKGVPITKYCDDARLAPRERLELFVPVCQAVQHAHLKGIIHRDLKPSNILVGLYDGLPVPKVIDFGVAKLTGPRISEHSVYTEVGSLVGTLEYMSPEQANLDNLDVDTRTDIYALGVVLYELLAGQVPFSRKELATSGLHEMLRVIKEVEPDKPSTKLSHSGSAPSIASVRRTDPGKLASLLQGELDWIAMKCLEKDRSRRYETAGALARDLQRYLADEPVEAGPPTAWYRLRKLLRRHRGRALAAAFLLAFLALGVAGTAWGLVRAVSAEGLSNQRLDEAKAALAKQDVEINYSRVMGNFMRSDFLALNSAESQDPFAGELRGGLDKGATLRQMLDRAAAKLDGFKGQELRIEADLRWMVGMNYRGLGDPKTAIPFLEQCVALREKQFGLDGKPTLVAQFDLADTLRQTGRHAEAVALFEKVRQGEVKQGGTDDPRALRAMSELAGAYLFVGRMPEGVALLEEVRRVVVAKLGPDHAEAVAAQHRLASACLASGQTERAVALLEEARDLVAKKLGADHLDTLRARTRLAIAYGRAGRRPQAIEMAEQVRAAAERTLAKDHPFALAAARNLALAYQQDGRLPPAIALLESTRGALAAKFGPDHRDTVDTAALLAAAQRAAAKP